MTIPTPAWSTPAQAGLVDNQMGVKGLGFPGTLASQVLLVISKRRSLVQWLRCLDDAAN